MLRKHYPQLDDLEEVELLQRRIKFVPVNRAAWATPPQPAQLIVFPEFKPGEVPAVTPTAPLDALALLAEERLWLGNPMTEEKVRRFLEWLEIIPAYRITCPDLETAERQIVGLYNRPKLAA